MAKTTTSRRKRLQAARTSSLPQSEPMPSVVYGPFVVYRTGEEARSALALFCAKAAADNTEKALIEVLQERDAAEDFGDKVLDLVLGADRPEWSSAYGTEEALAQVEEMMFAIDASLAVTQAQPATTPVTAILQLGSGFYGDRWVDADTLKAIVDAAQPATAQAEPGMYYTDAYAGAREDLSIWKRRALEAERDLRAERATTSRLAAEINAMRAGEQEPVAWRYKTPTGWHATTDASAAIRVRNHHATEPLYTSPVATQGEQDTIKARRYDYLRDGVIVDGEINKDLYVRVDHQSYPNRWALTGPVLDEAIDAALSATTPLVATTKEG